MFKLLFIVVALLVSPDVPQKSKPAVVARLVCARTETIKPNTTALHCGRDAQGREEIHDIPETVAVFEGDVFTFNRFSDGTWSPTKTQPKGSRIYVMPPCPAKTKPRPGEYKRKPVGKPLCNPALPPK
jgi:hypothetical protein